MTDVKLLITGVTGSGKTAVGMALAEKLGLRYVEGDSLHPKANLQKLARGVLLSDADREPWIENILKALEEPNVVIGAALLKRSHRKRIQKAHGDAKFIQLTAPMRVLAARIQDRETFFRQDLLDSQIVLMDPLRRDERGAIYDATQSVNDLVNLITFDLIKK